MVMTGVNPTLKVVLLKTSQFKRYRYKKYAKSENLELRHDNYANKVYMSSSILDF